MAAPPYKINDRRSSSGYMGGGNNRMIEAATRQPDRKDVPRTGDFHRNITAYGRARLMDLGRWMFWNIPAYHGAVLEQANLALGTFLPQFYGENTDWGNQAESWLYDWHRIGDISGPPNNRRTYLQYLTILPVTDGDFGTLLTGTPTGNNELGYPMWQVIPGHRIRSGSEEKVQGGPYDGARIMDGVIINDYGRALAYRVYGEGTATSETFQDISTNDMFLTFYPLFPGQLRGLPAAVASFFNWQDKGEFDRFEMLAHKAFSAHTIIETNETGDTDSSKAVLAGATQYDSSGNKTAPEQQVLDGGIYRYFRANTGSKLEAFAFDRPGSGVMQFQDKIVRDAFKGSEWDAFFSLDPQAVGGAPMRIIVEKINRVLEKRRAIAEEACRRIDGYAVSKAIKLGDLPEDVDWYKWEYQGPGNVTADAKYDSDVGLQETAQGFSTRKLQAAKRGQYWEDLDAQRELEADSDLARAQRLATKYKITIQEALVILRPPTPSGQLPQPPQQPQDNQPAKP